MTQPEHTVSLLLAGDDDAATTANHASHKPSNGKPLPLEVASSTAASASPFSLSHRSARPTIPVLTGLRGLLAFWVFLHNYSLFLSPAAAVELAASWAVLSGSVAVGAFFVLSGFILCYNYAHHSFASLTCYTAFLCRRYARLLPLYYCSQLMSIGLPITVYSALPPHPIDYAMMAAAALAAQTWIPWPSDPEHYNGYIIGNSGTLWSVQTELAFYVVFPLLVRLFRGSSRLRLVGLFLIFSITSCIPTIILSSFPDTPYEVVLYTAPYVRISEFMLGIVACLLYFSVGRQRQQQPDENFITRLLHSPYVVDIFTVAFVVTLIMIAYPPFNVSLVLLQHNPGTFAPFLSLYLICLVCVSTSQVASSSGYRSLIIRLFCTEWMQRMGELSYAFYAFHAVPFIYTVTVTQEQSMPSSFLIFFTSSLGLALVGHYYIELPFYQYASRRLAKCSCPDDHEGLRELHAADETVSAGIGMAEVKA